MVKRYAPSGSGDEYDEGKVLYANATLMKSLGRTLFKVAEALAKQQKDFKLKNKNVVLTGPVLDEASNKEKLDVMKAIMHDRLYKIEGEYASALVAAGVFNEARKKPESFPKKQ